MFLVEAVLTVGGSRPFADDVVADLIERLIDELDGLPVAPSVGSLRLNDHQLELRVGVVIDQPDQFAAISEGMAIIAAGLKAADVGDPNGVLPMAPGVPLRSEVRVLEAV